MKQMQPKRTWSQQKLAVERHLAGEKESGPLGGFLTGEKRSMLLLAGKTALAAGLCYWLATLAHLQDGYWGSISAIIVLQSNVGSTVTASRDRLIGTLIGAAFGAGFSLVGSSENGPATVLGVYLMAVVLAMVTCSLLGLKNSSRLAGVTVTIILLVHRTGSNWTLPMHRVLEVLLGIVVALAISTLVLPSRARLRLQDGLAQEFLLLGALFKARMAGLRGRSEGSTGGSAAGNLEHIGKDLAEAISANGLLLDAARHEPSNGAISTEALGLVHQFGRELEDLLKALALAAGGGDKEAIAGYLCHLEPELGQLETDIQRGFQFVAGCIHRWRFDEEPEGLALEQDVAALEARMAAIRPAGLDFPQAAILRAYAVQLHMKQVARLLRRSRLETGNLA